MILHRGACRCIIDFYSSYQDLTCNWILLIHVSLMRLRCFCENSVIVMFVTPCCNFNVQLDFAKCIIKQTSYLHPDAIRSNSVLLFTTTLTFTSNFLASYFSAREKQNCVCYVRCHSLRGRYIELNIFSNIRINSGISRSSKYSKHVHICLHLFI